MQYRREHHQHREAGQAMVLAALIVGVLITFMLYILINAGGWYRDVRLIDQAIVRSARDGTTALEYAGSLTLQPLTAPHSLPATPNSDHCLNPTQAKALARAALERNLKLLQRKFVTQDGQPLSAAQIAGDTTGAYLTLAAGNPPAMGCPVQGDAHPAGATFSHPWVYVRVNIPVKAFFGSSIITWVSETNATSAVSKRGG